MGAVQPNLSVMMLMLSLIYILHRIYVTSQRNGSYVGLCKQEEGCVYYYHIVAPKSFSRVEIIMLGYYIESKHP